VYILIVARERPGKTVTAATNTHSTRDGLLDASFPMQSVSYQGKFGNYFFPELLSKCVLLLSSKNKIRRYCDRQKKPDLVILMDSHVFSIPGPSSNYTCLTSVSILRIVSLRNSMKFEVSHMQSKYSERNIHCLCYRGIYIHVLQQVLV
jgi:hypothetical protein